ncbi:MAG: hypothetical protein ACRDTE_12945 [Pseudonocardiaceae bacterium]
MVGVDGELLSDPGGFPDPGGKLRRLADADSHLCPGLTADQVQDHAAARAIAVTVPSGAAGARLCTGTIQCSRRSSPVTGQPARVGRRRGGPDESATPGHLCCPSGPPLLAWFGGDRSGTHSGIGGIGAHGGVTVVSVEPAGDLYRRRDTSGGNFSPSLPTALACSEAAGTAEVPARHDR